MRRKNRFIFLFVTLLIVAATGCEKAETSDEQNETDKTIDIVYLHHSTGRVIWEGQPSLLEKLGVGTDQPAIPAYLEEYNDQYATDYQITAREFPAASPYGWNNYPYDYYNIWVKHGDEQYFQEEPTLKVLSAEYDVIVFKHCFPVSHMQQGSSPGDPDSPDKTLVNYMAQYVLLKDKMHAYPNTKFLLWTGPALLQSHTNEREALNTKEFYEWVKNTWDKPGDNIYLWDFRELETEGSLYLKIENAAGPDNSHPSYKFGQAAAKLFVQRLTDVIEDDGTNTERTGKRINDKQ